MANWCNNQAFFASYNKEALINLKKKIEKEGKDLLTYQVIGSISDIDTAVKDASYYYFEVNSESKWESHMDDFQVFNYQQDDINLYYQSYEPGNLIAESNDENNHFFTDRFILEDMCDGDWETNYFSSLIDAIEYINFEFRLELKIFSTFEQVQEELKDYVEFFNKGLKDENEEIEITLVKINMI